MQNRNIFRWIAAVIITVLVSYLRVTGYLPESTQETAHEGQPAAESEQETVAENETSAENEQDENSNKKNDHRSGGCNDYRRIDTAQPPVVSIDSPPE